MTYGKDLLPGPINYRRTSPARVEMPLRLRLFLFALTVAAISFGVLLAYLLH